MPPKRGPTPDRFHEDGDEMSGVKDLDDEGCEVKMGRTFLPMNPGHFL
jgi:hypothetical protein